VGGEPDLDAELAQAKSGKFGVGFITWALERAPKTLTKALQYSPFCVFLSFGDPIPFAAEIAKAAAPAFTAMSMCDRNSTVPA
jgi:nitronate monooxygenase